MPFGVSKVVVVIFVKTIIIMDITRRRRSTGPTEEAWIHEAVRETGGRGKTTTLVT